MSAAPVLDAVTAVITCGPDLFLARRQPHLPSFSGFHAFPGGKVDKTDADTPFGHPLLDAHPPRLMRALVRELQEEIGLDLPALCASGGVLRITDLGTAVTPPIAPLRFNTHFYAIRLNAQPALVLDPGETADGDWLPPAAWAQRYAQGEILCAPPTLAVLYALSDDIAATGVPGLHFEFREQTELPMVENLHGVRQVFVRSNTIPPAQFTNAYLLGDFPNHRVLVDPSPKTDEEMEKLLALSARIGIHEIFLTHHHPDHRERANVMARRLQMPMGMSADTQARIEAKQPGWFEGIDVHHYREGDVLCRWLGQPVRVLEVPGHDEGQLALMPDNRAWCIVGDLIQGIGTVVIAAPEGNMRKYFATLEKVIALDPRVIYPSHGSALGTVYRLRETLKHRIQREQQVAALDREGKTPEAMLPLLYQDVNPALWPLALMNIRAHLEKLRTEPI